MRLILILSTVLFFSLSYAGIDCIDITATDTNLYIASENSVEIYGTSIQNTFGEGIIFPSIGLATFQGEQVLVYSFYSYDCPDSIFILDLNSLAVIAEREITPSQLAYLSYPEEGQMQMKLARHQPDSDSFYLSATPGLSASGNMENNIVSVKLTYSEAEGISIADTLGANFDSYCASINSFTRPVCCSGTLPLLMWSVYGSYGTSLLSEFTALHQIDGDPVQGNYEPILYSSFYSIQGAFTPGSVKGSGSSATDALVLWATENNAELKYGVYDCNGVEPILTEPVDFGPEASFPMAMSCNPSDDGLLLVWANLGAIHCRYWDGEWISLNYTVEADTEDPLDGALKVCSVNDGYWVVWVTYPSEDLEVRFVPREDVMSINDDMQSDSGINLEISINPSSVSTCISVAGTSEQLHISVYSLSGRLIDTIVLDSSGMGILNTTYMPEGTYLLTAVSNGERLVKKMVILH